MVLHLGANAQVVVDNSFGSPGALNGPNFKIPDTLGKTVGGNLFHSFNEFSATERPVGNIHRAGFNSEYPWKSNRGEGVGD